MITANLHRFQFVALLLCAANTMSVNAQPIQLVNGTVNMFRDTRGANDVGIGQGEVFQFGADIVGGSLNATLSAAYQDGFSRGPIPCAPLAVNRNFCGGSIGFHAGRLDPWTFSFNRGSNNLQVQGPSLLGAESAVPFPVSVAMSGTGLTPTISWQVPAAIAPDGFRVVIYDKGRILANGQADVIHIEAVSAAATSFTVPEILNSGLTLRQGGNYTINLQMIETRDGLQFKNNNAQILRRSNAFFAFTPLTGDVPSDVALPTVVDGVYNFNISEVGPDKITFIDPIVAIGYDYAIGPGDPNFASVVLPDVGDGLFTLEYTGATGTKTVDLATGTQYFFDQGGVGAFKVRGIETSAALDPANVTAFITGLTFVAQGTFTGTMTPAVLSVPEPSAYALFSIGIVGLAGLAGARRRALLGHSRVASPNLS